MKKLAVSSLGLAMWMGGAAAAQSPFFQPSAQLPPAQLDQPIQPVARKTVAPPALPGGFIPVRVHFGGALTKDGTVPLQVYMNHPGGAPMGTVAAPQSPASAIHQVSQKSGGDAKSVVPETLPAPKAAADESYAPAIVDPRFAPPEGDDYYRPHRAPRGNRWYTAAEYQYWWVRHQESPALLLVGGNPVSAQDIDPHTRHGGRFTVGRWLDTPHHAWALEGSFLFAGTRQAHGVYNSNGVVTLAHPFTDADTGAPSTFNVAVDPPALDPREGSSDFEVTSRFYGFEVNLRRELCRFCNGHFDFLFGYRQFHLDENITIRDTIVYDTNPIPLSDATVTSFDNFGTHNRLFAGQVGVEGELNWRRFYVDVWGKVALGGMEEVINVNGATFVRATPGRQPPPPALANRNLAGSLYALPSNIGSFEDSQFTVLPEAGFTVGFKITPNWRVGAGYNILFLNNVVRPGDAIDTTITRIQIPQLQPLATDVGTRPAPPAFTETYYWAHGITVQMEVRY